MTVSIDLDRYCARIGYDGSGAPTLHTLAALHLAHARAIPFENLDPLLGVTPKLDAASLDEKLVSQRRGGYCFEHNLLFRHALEGMGFRVASLAARVLWNNTAALLPRSHMLLRVDLPEGPHIADVGFGSLTLTAPLAFVPDLVQTTPHESFRLVTPREGFYRMEVAIASEWKALYEFDSQEQELIDYEVVNWYLSTNARSHFIRDLVAARADRDRRYALRNTSFAVHHAGGWTDRRVLTSANDLKDVLTGPLGIVLPDGPSVEAVLDRVVTSAPTPAVPTKSDTASVSW